MKGATADLQDGVGRALASQQQLVEKQSALLAGLATIEAAEAERASLADSRWLVPPPCPAWPCSFSRNPCLPAALAPAFRTSERAGRFFFFF